MILCGVNQCKAARVLCKMQRCGAIEKNKRSHEGAANCRATKKKNEKLERAAEVDCGLFTCRTHVGGVSNPTLDIRFAQVARITRTTRPANPRVARDGCCLHYSWWCKPPLQLDEVCIDIFGAICTGEAGRCEHGIGR